MQSNSRSNWWPAMAAFVLAALAAGSAAYWALKWPGSGTRMPVSAIATTEPSPSDPLALSRALGGAMTVGPTAIPDVAQPGAGSRLALVGVVANGKRGGAALISVDGKPARPYRVGSRIENELVLVSVAPRSAGLATDANAPVSVTLEMPALRK